MEIPEIERVAKPHDGLLPVYIESIYSMQRKTGEYVVAAVTHSDETIREYTVELQTTQVRAHIIEADGTLFAPFIENYNVEGPDYVDHLIVATRQAIRQIDRNESNS